MPSMTLITPTTKTTQGCSYPSIKETHTLHRHAPRCIVIHFQHEIYHRVWWCTAEIADGRME